MVRHVEGTGLYLSACITCICNFKRKSIELKKGVFNMCLHVPCISFVSAREDRRCASNGGPVRSRWRTDGTRSRLPV